MNIIERIIEEKNAELRAFADKKARRTQLADELKNLDLEIEAFDSDKVLADIDELTACNEKLNRLTDSSEPEMCSSYSTVL